MSTQAGLMTVEEYLKLPDPPGGYYELRHGEAVLVTYPKSGHQRRQKRIDVLLTRLAGAKGEVRSEYAFQPTPEYNVWAADVAYVRAEREHAVGDEEYLMGAPDLVVEVLSPSNSIDEMNDRMAICLDHGCSSFWVVDEKRKRLSVTEGNVTHHYGINDSFHCDVIGATVQVRDIFA
jgi:Uma2 family endonuclease